MIRESLNILMCFTDSDFFQPLLDLDIKVFDADLYVFWTLQRVRWDDRLISIFLVALLPFNRITMKPYQEKG